MGGSTLTLLWGWLVNARKHLTESFSLFSESPLCRARSRLHSANLCGLYRGSDARRRGKRQTFSHSETLWEVFVWSGMSEGVSSHRLYEADQQPESITSTQQGPGGRASKWHRQSLPANYPHTAQPFMQAMGAWIKFGVDHLSPRMKKKKIFKY